MVLSANTKQSKTIRLNLSSADHINNVDFFSPFYFLIPLGDEVEQFTALPHK